MLSVTKKKGTLSHKVYEAMKHVLTLNKKLSSYDLYLSRECAFNIYIYIYNRLFRFQSRSKYIHIKKERLWT